VKNIKEMSDAELMQAHMMAEVNGTSTALELWKEMRRRGLPTELFTAEWQKKYEEVHKKCKEV